MPEPLEAPRPPRIVPSKRIAALWVLITVAIWVASAGWLINSARADARAGEAALRSVADLSDPTEVDLDEVAAALSSGRLDLERAQSRLESPLLLPLRPLPVVGRQMDSAQSLITVTEDVVAELDPLVARARDVRNDPNGIDRVGFLHEVADRFGALDEIIESADLGPDTELLPALADGRFELGTRLLDLQEQARRYRLIASGMALFLDGSTYLLAGANNAEMRLGTGMFLSIGRLETSDGDFELPGLTPAADFVPITGASVLDPDVARMWGFTSVSSDFRSIGYSARFDEHLAPQALELWQSSTGEELDGVLMVDPFVLDALLGVIGEVEVEGRIFRQGEALDYLLSEQYAAFDPEELDERRDVLSLMAAAVVEKLETTAWDPIDLLRQLEPVANGRHIMAYSEDPEQQAAWHAMGVDGSLTGTETGVFLLNHGASKLDPVVRLAVDANTREVADTTVVTYEVSISNDAAPGLPEYVAGPWDSLGLPEFGTYLGRIAVYVPGSADDTRTVAGLPVDASGPDGPVHQITSQLIEIPPGTTRRFLFEYTLPADVQAIDLLPSGRFPAAEWTWNTDTFDDANARTIAFGS